MSDAISNTPRSPYGVFKTDEHIESTGVRIDYGEFWFLLARAGGANTRYTKLVTEKLRPHRRAIQTETLPDALGRKLMLECFIGGCLLGWGSLTYGEGSIAGPTGEAIPFTHENALRVLTDLPDLFDALRVEADNQSNFRKGSLETDAGN